MRPTAPPRRHDAAPLRPAAPPSTRPAAAALPLGNNDSSDAPPPPPPSFPAPAVGNVPADATPRQRFDYDLMGASRRGSRDNYGWAAVHSDGEGGSDGAAEFAAEKMAARAARVEVPFAVIALADELWALMLENDVSTEEGAVALAAALVATLPPPGVGSSGPDMFAHRPGGRANMRDVESLGERDMVAILRRVGRRAGGQAAVALREFFEATGAGYVTRAPRVHTVLLHVCSLNADDRAADAVLAGLKADGVEPNAEQWTLAATTYAKTQRVDDALAALDAACEAAAKAAAAEAGEDGDEAATPLSLPPPDVVAASHVLSALDRAATPAAGAAARALWARMDAGGARGNAFTHRSLVGAVARGGDIHGAVDLAKSIYPADTLLPPPVSSMILTCAAAAGEWDIARDAAVQLGDDRAQYDPLAATRAVSDLLRVALDDAAPPDAAAVAATFALEVVAMLRPRYAADWLPHVQIPGLQPKHNVNAFRLARTAATTHDPAAVRRVVDWVKADGVPVGSRFWARTAAAALALGDREGASEILRASVCELSPSKLAAIADDIDADVDEADTPRILGLLEARAAKTGALPEPALGRGGRGRGRGFVPPPPPPRGAWPPPSRRPLGADAQQQRPVRTAAEVQGAATRLAAAVRAGEVAPGRASSALAAISLDAARLPDGGGKDGALAAVEAARAALGMRDARGPPVGGRGCGRRG